MPAIWGDDFGGRSSPGSIDLPGEGAHPASWKLVLSRAARLASRLTERRDSPETGRSVGLDPWWR